MFNFFKKKCPVCKMELEKGKEYPKLGDVELCSENCKDEYSKTMSANQGDHSHHSGGGYCH